MITEPDHPGYSPWAEPVETYVDQVGSRSPSFNGSTRERTMTQEGVGKRQTRRLPPDFFLRHPKVGTLPLHQYRRPRQCVIDDDDAISFSQARAILEPECKATADEIYLWLALEHPRLHAFSGGHEVWDDVEGYEFLLCRRKPGLPGSTRTCVDFFSSCGLPRMLSGPDQDSPVELLSRFRFSRAEVEAFDPAGNGNDPSTEIEYWSDEIGMTGRNWFNPSGRYLSHDQAVAFLATWCTPEEAAAVVKREYDRGDLNGFSATSRILWLHCGAGDLPPPAEAYFLEGQVVALARMEFDAPVRRWDEASRPNTLLQSEMPAAEGPSEVGSEDKNVADIDRRVARIVAIAEGFDYPLMTIPRGGKNRIGDACLADAKLFSKDTFEKAWQEAKRRVLIEIANVDKYRTERQKRSKLR